MKAKRPRDTDRYRHQSRAPANHARPIDQPRLAIIIISTICGEAKVGSLITAAKNRAFSDLAKVKGAADPLSIGYLSRRSICCNGLAGTSKNCAVCDHSTRERRAVEATPHLLICCQSTASAFCPERSNPCLGAKGITPVHV